MNINIIAAVDNKGGLGKDGHLLFNIKEDLKHFKEITYGHPCIMGRLTFESLQKPLSGRRNLVVSSKFLQRQGFEFFQNPESALASCRGCQSVFIIGGALLYKYFLPRADAIYLTRIDSDKEADTYFPSINSTDWERSYCQGPIIDEQSGQRFYFERYVRSNRNLTSLYEYDLP